MISGIVGLAAVPAISHSVFAQNRGLVRWSGALAMLGFAVNARSHLMEVAFDRKIIPFYPEAEPAWQEAVNVIAGLTLDVPDGFLTYGAIGFWLLVVSVLALRGRVFPRILCYLGITAAITYLFGVIGYTFLVRWLLVISIGVGRLLLVPTRYIWVGWLLCGKRPNASPQQTR